MWGLVEFLLAALLLLLIGLLLRGIVERLTDHDAWHLTGLGLAVSAALIFSRYSWAFPAVWLPRALSRRMGEVAPMQPIEQLTVLSWAGMRDVGSLAADHLCRRNSRTRSDRLPSFLRNLRDAGLAGHHQRLAR